MIAMAAVRPTARGGVPGAAPPRSTRLGPESRTRAPAAAGSTRGRGAERTGRCWWCGRWVAPARELYAVLADSSVVHPSDPARDGRRLVMACGDAHLTRLQVA